MPIIPHNPRLSNGQQMRSLPSGPETSKDRAMYIRDRTGNRHSVMVASAVSKYFVISRRMVSADMSALVDFRSIVGPHSLLPLCQHRQAKSKGKNSYIWNHGEKIIHEGKDRWKCNHSRRTYAISGSSLQIKRSNRLMKMLAAAMN